MSTICPTITAYDPHQYREQMHKVGVLSERLHIDFMDGDFAPTLSPSVDDAWWPHTVQADFHIMYRRPMDYVESFIRLRPHLVIIHAEADVHHMHFAAELHKNGIKVGLALLSDTPVSNVEQILHSFDHLLIFSGQLGHHGGHADLELLQKVVQAKSHHPELEFGWDGGINQHNVRQLVAGGIDVLNIGGAIHSADDAAASYEELRQLAAD